MSERDIHDDTEEALSSPGLSPVGLVELEFGSGTVRLWTGFGTITAPDGREWYGAGHLGKIGQIEETVESRATSVALELSGVGEPIEVDGVELDVIAIAHSEDWQQRPGSVWYGVLDDNLRWVGEPFQIAEGIMDQMQLSEGEEANVRITLESEFIDLERAEARRHTAEDQRSEYPGDAGCDQVAALQDKAVVWNLS